MTEAEKITMDFEQFKEKILLSLATIFVSICASVAWSLFSLNDKVYLMNEKMAVIVEKVAQHDGQLKMILEDMRDARK
jgi:cell division protein FtsL